MKYVFKDRGNRLPPVKLSGAGAVLGKSSIEDFLVIRVAGNEQKPLDFHSDYVKAGRGVIKTFDYCLEQEGSDGWAIERKSLSDYISSVALNKNWQHELAKIERAKLWHLPIEYVFEFSFDDIGAYDYSIFPSGKITSQTIYGKWARMVYDLGVTTTFAGSRSGAAYVICLLLKRRKESLRTNQKRQVGNKEIRPCVDG